jgi:hypothetical protein
MPLELGIWRIDGGLRRLAVGSLDQEARLEDILDQDILREERSNGTQLLT